MADDDQAGASAGNEPLTTTVVGLLAFLGLAGTVFLAIYAIWWLATFWAPA
jgi:hypothetical protein